MKLVTSAVMREMDRRTMEEFHIPGILLMENAALRVVEAIAARPSPLTGRERIVVVCGKGNNGGDGLAIARHLGVRYAARVEIWLAFDPSEMAGDAAANLRMAQSLGLPIRRYEKSCAGEFEAALADADVIVDALLGTGIRGRIEGLVAKMIEAINAIDRPSEPRLRHSFPKPEARPLKAACVVPSADLTIEWTPVKRPFVVAVDVPSGVDADTGCVDGAAIQADLTVTFALAKIGLMLFPGASQVGELVVGDIGMPRLVIDEATPTAVVTRKRDVAERILDRVNGRDVNKGQFGHVLLIAGSSGFLGAARLASAASARAGAGLVTLAVPDGLLAPAMAAVIAPVMTRGLAETALGTYAKRALGPALDLCGRGSAAAIGPGLGGVATHPLPLVETGEDSLSDTTEFALSFIHQCPIPLVIDADALNILAASTDHGAPVVASRGAPTVLTPHPTELGRLLGIPTAEVQADRLSVVREAAARYRCTVLLKGARTLVASPDGRVNMNVTGNPGMGTGGAGDVLTGIVASFLAAGVAGHEAASLGAFVHGLAGDLAAEKRGMTGLTADDLVDHLPEAIARCHSSDSAR